MRCPRPLGLQGQRKSGRKFPSHLSQSHTVSMGSHLDLPQLFSSAGVHLFGFVNWCLRHCILKTRPIFVKQHHCSTRRLAWRRTALKRDKVGTTASPSVDSFFREKRSTANDTFQEKKKRPKAQEKATFTASDSKIRGKKTQNEGQQKQSIDANQTCTTAERKVAFHHTRGLLTSNEGLGESEFRKQQRVRSLKPLLLWHGRLWRGCSPLSTYATSSPSTLRL